MINIDDHRPTRGNRAAFVPETRRVHQVVVVMTDGKFQSGLPQFKNAGEMARKSAEALRGGKGWRPEEDKDRRTIRQAPCGGYDNCTAADPFLSLTDVAGRGGKVECAGALSILGVQVPAAVQVELAGLRYGVLIIRKLKPGQVQIKK